MTLNLLQEFLYLYAISSMIFELYPNLNTTTIKLFSEAHYGFDSLLFLV